MRIIYIPCISNRSVPSDIHQKNYRSHYNDVIMSVKVPQITCISIVCSTVCWGTDQRNHQKLHIAGSKRASNMENVSIWQRHYVMSVFLQHLQYKHSIVSSLLMKALFWICCVECLMWDQSMLMIWEHLVVFQLLFSDSIPIADVFLCC